MSIFGLEEKVIPEDNFNEKKIYFWREKASGSRFNFFINIPF